MINILFILTSHDQLGDTGQKTGFWIEELAAPYYFLTDLGVNVALASPKGGQPPIDPKSSEPENLTQAALRFLDDEALREKLSLTLKVAEVNALEYDAVFLPGGHGPLWDLTENKEVIHLLQQFLLSGKPISAVCHAPAALLNVRDANGDFLVKGRNVTGFANTEEQAVGLTQVVPFLLEDELKKRGANYSKKADWQPYAIADGKLITGQNPASSQAVAKNLLALLNVNRQKPDEPVFAVL